MGSDELGLDPMGTNETDGFVKLKPRDEWRQQDKAWVVDQIRAVTDRFAGVNFSFTQPIEMRVSELISGVRGDLAVKIFGPDLATLDDLARTHRRASCEQIEGSEDVNAAQNGGVQYLQIALDRGRIGRAGLAVEDVQDDLRSMVEGRQAGVVVENGRRLPLLLRGPLAAATGVSPDLFAQLRLPGTDRQGHSADAAGAAGAHRGPGEDRARERLAHGGGARQRARPRPGRLRGGGPRPGRRAMCRCLPAITLTWGGQFENQQRTAARLALVVPVALALIFLLLFATFASVRQALLVFANIPFALVGGVFALALTRRIPVGAGLGGLHRADGHRGAQRPGDDQLLQPAARRAACGIDEVVREGAVRRLRPVLMTASITAFGLVPLLFATGPGSEIQKPLAIVVIGGLVSSTALTLVLLPSLFRRFGVEKIDGCHPPNASTAC